MSDIAPIKRNKSLVSLSRDHHDGLLVVWKLRQGMRLNIEVERMIHFIINAFEQEEEPHFCAEEQFLFAAIPADNEWRIQAEADHAAMRKMVTMLKNGNNNTVADVEAFASALESHIRFEERTLFPYFEKAVSAAILE